MEERFELDNNLSVTVKSESDGVTESEKWEKFCFSLGILRVFRCFNVFFCAFNSCFIAN